MCIGDGFKAPCKYDNWRMLEVLIEDGNLYITTHSLEHFNSSLNVLEYLE